MGTRFASRPHLLSSRFCVRSLSALPRRAAAALALAGACAATVVASTPAAAQLIARPWLAWRSASSGRFVVHYAEPLAPFALDLAARLPAIDSAVAGLVGFTPAGRVDIVVEDPFQRPNGMAFTSLESPVIVAWATPADPRDEIGDFRRWSEMLATHELAHVAHLTRPSRNAVTRLLWRVSPVDLGPIAVRAPRWAIEGYATVVEGRVTGRGRPGSVWRAAILREWALEGRLPTYAQLNAWDAFEGGSFAYLAGSAFLEWLVARPGMSDMSLTFVWRRLSARRTRTFDEAFAGVFGDTPRALYGRFVADLTARAVTAAAAIDSAGTVEGEIVQRLAWATGDPALARDGQRVAVVLRSRHRPSRIEVWKTVAGPDTVRRRQDSLMLARDPDDVAARSTYPPPRRALATLRASSGAAFISPRWFADGRALLVSRVAQRADGSYLADLYRWDLDRAPPHRLTNGAGVSTADPSPDGRWAAALRCGAGHCDVVRVDLASGGVRVLARGDQSVSYSRPRVSPDGRRIAVARHADSHWEVALIASETGAVTPVSSPSAATPGDRFDPAWLSDSALVVVSTAAGTANLEAVRLDGMEQATSSAPLTRTAGAFVAPDVDRGTGDVWYLALHATGYDVRRLPAGERGAMNVSAALPLRDAALWPASVPRRAAAATLGSATTSPQGGAYELWHRTTRVVPTAASAAGGSAAGVAVANTDVVGRLALLVRGAVGSGSTWRGGAVDAVWRGARPSLGGAAFAVATDGLVDPAGSRTTRLRGASAGARYARAGDGHSTWVRAGGAIAEVTSSRHSRSRNLAFGAVGGAVQRRGDRGALAAESSVAVDAVSTGGEHRVIRVSGGADLSADAYSLPGLLLSIHGGQQTATDPSSFERFTLGGLPVDLIDSAVVAQRVAMPALSHGIATGDRFASLRVAARVGLLEPYLWSGSVGERDRRLDRWHRVVGVEVPLSIGAVSVLGTPGMAARAGVSLSIDAPSAGAIGGYLSVVLFP